MVLVNFIKNNTKLTAGIVASLFALIGLLAGLEVSEILVITAPLGFGYPIGQGLADFGKESKKIEKEV